MGYEIEKKLKALGLVLPPPSPRFDNRVVASRVG